MDLAWQLVHHGNLSAHQTYDMLRLRGVVFIDEQKVSADLEIDGRDLEGEVHHLFAYAGDELAAYARILGPDRHGHSHIGRVVVAAAFRGTSTGHHLVERAVAAADRLWPAVPIAVSAQDHLRGFYGRHGFVADGEVYEEAGIPHVDMVRPPA